MPPTFCLLPKHAEELAKRFASGRLSPARLAAMSSAERHAAFAEIIGDANAGHLNASFESKLLLKHQQDGIKGWVNSLGDVKPDVKRDLLSRVERMDRVLEPKSLHSFLSDLAHQKLGFGVTMEEAGKITELSKTIADAKQLPLLPNGDRPLAYGRARVEFGNYVTGLKEPPLTLKAVVKDLPGLSKAVNASLDNSAVFRQGSNVFFTDNAIWRKNALQSFRDIVDTFGGKHVMDEVNARIYSSRHYDSYRKMKLAVGVVEEAYPTSLPERIPGLGKAYQAAENAFTAFQYRNRMDIADQTLDALSLAGRDVKNDVALLESAGKMVNSLTARGNLGPVEPIAGVINNVLFSGRKVKGDWDVLTAHAFDASMDPAVRGLAKGQIVGVAAKNLFKVAIGSGGIMAIANAIKPGSAETDARSTDFGKIKVGDTRYDYTGGKSSLVVLSARIAFLVASHYDESIMSFKSSTTGKMSQINSGKFGAPTGLTVIGQFLMNKLSPIGSVVKEHLAGRTFDGAKPTPLHDLSTLFEPMPSKTFRELYSAPDANVGLGMLADALGINVNTYSPKPKKAKP